MSVTSQEELALIAFFSSLLQVIPFLVGETAACPQLAHLAGQAMGSSSPVRLQDWAGAQGAVTPASARGCEVF